MSGRKKQPPAVKCPTCQGTGWNGMRMANCLSCHGSGHLPPEEAQDKQDSLFDQAQLEGDLAREATTKEDA